MKKKFLRVWLEKGFRFAYHYKKGATLKDALTYRFVATNEAFARKTAQSIQTQAEKEIKVWDIQQELLNLDKLKNKT